MVVRPSSLDGTVLFRSIKTVRIGSIPVKPDFFEQFMNGSRHPGGSNALPIGPPAPGRPR
jgi:hypothetical protein